MARAKFLISMNNGSILGVGIRHRVLNESVVGSTESPLIPVGFFFAIRDPRCPWWFFMCAYFSSGCMTKNT